MKLNVNKQYILMQLTTLLDETAMQLLDLIVKTQFNPKDKAL